MPAVNLSTLLPFDGDTTRVVVESPRGCSLKLEYVPEDEFFRIARGLPLGMVYPFDWGFVPGTLGQDGDPLDAMVIHPSSSFPGVVLPCRLLGMVEIRQRDKGGRKMVNNRIIATPDWHVPLRDIEDPRDLPADIRAELERFFVAVTAFTGKKVRIHGWSGRRKALKFVKQSAVSNGGK